MASVNIVPYGTQVATTAFFAAVVPVTGRRGAGGPKLHVPLCQTALLAKGKIVRWLHTAPNGEAAERLMQSKEEVFQSFKKDGEFPEARSRDAASA
jgi:hypothetical protein